MPGVFYPATNTFAVVKTALLTLMLFVHTVVPARPLACCTGNEEDAICGIWYTQNNNSKVEIFNKNGAYFGKIIWLKDQQKAAYANKLVIMDMTYNYDRKMWDKGTLYYPVKDAQYKGYISLPDRNTLHIRVYLGSPLIGRTLTWVRAK